MGAALMAAPSLVLKLRAEQGPPARQDAGTPEVAARPARQRESTHPPERRDHRDDGSGRRSVAPTDQLTFVGTTILFLVVAALAVFVPVQRRARVDPVVAVRQQ